MSTPGLRIKAEVRPERQVLLVGEICWVDVCRTVSKTVHATHRTLHLIRSHHVFTNMHFIGFSSILITLTSAPSSPPTGINPTHSETQVNLGVIEDCRCGPNLADHPAYILDEPVVRQPLASSDSNQRCSRSLPRSQALGGIGITRRKGFNPRSLLIVLRWEHPDSWNSPAANISLVVDGPRVSRLSAIGKAL